MEILKPANTPGGVIKTTFEVECGGGRYAYVTFRIPLYEHAPRVLDAALLKACHDPEGARAYLARVHATLRASAPIPDPEPERFL